MPVPLDAIKVKFSQIFIVIMERITAVSMPTVSIRLSSVMILLLCLPYFIASHSLKALSFTILYNKYMIYFNDRRNVVRYNSVGFRFGKQQSRSGNP